MEWQPLESKMFLSAAYDAKGQILYLRFRSGVVYRTLSSRTVCTTSSLTRSLTTATSAVTSGITSATNAWLSSGALDVKTVLPQRLPWNGSR